MKAILSSWKHSYLARIGIFLIAIALIVGLVSCEGDCNGNGGVKYSLTMAANPPAGGTATDLTGGSPYTTNTSVSIQAVAAVNYQFVNWTASAGTFANATAATTTFTMPPQDVTVTANFVGPLIDHYVIYYAWNGTQYIGENVTLEDQFGAVNATVTYATSFVNPAEKWHDGVLSPIRYPDIHSVGYNITLEGEPGEWLVVVENQFGIQELTVSGPTGLGAPAQKLEPYYHDPPVGADHVLSYPVIAGEAVNQTVDLYDEFGNFTEVLVTNPRGICNPASKIHGGNVTEILNVGDMCWVNYYISLPYSPFQVKAVEQFGEENLDLVGPIILSVPSRILYYAPVQHSLCYWVTGGAQYIGENVTLEDRFGAVNATVEYAVVFANPVEKWHDGVVSPISDPDHHGLAYNISCEGEPGEWLVVVQNQFGIQSLTVSGPTSMVTPAQKLAPFYHDPPVGLDHGLAYYVIGGEAVNQTVDLYDEFGNYTGVSVLWPVVFGNPARKIHDGNVTEILTPGDLCSVNYVVASGPLAPFQVQVIDQFGNQTLELGGPGVGLVVPSIILYYQRIS